VRPTRRLARIFHDVKNLSSANSAVFVVEELLFELKRTRELLNRTKDFTSGRRAATLQSAFHEPIP
jgi:hypothetical protein